MTPAAKPKTDPSDLPVTVVALADLTPYPKNPRHITPAAVNAVAESLAAFGWQQPIVIGPKRVIVAGHTRRLAALQLGWTHAPTVTIQAKHARAYRLADNRSGEFSTWDLDVLGGELAALPSYLEALPALDFNAIVRQPVEGQADPDDIPAAPEPRTKLGDVWTLGEHRLMCGDSTDQACVHNLMDGAEADLLFTSPPYLNQRAYTTGGISDWDALMRGVFAHCPMTDSGQLLVNLGLVHEKKEWQPYWDGWIAWMREQGYLRFGWYVWNQLGPLPGHFAGRLAPSFEFVFHFNRRARKANKFMPCVTEGRVRPHNRNVASHDGRRLSFPKNKPTGAFKIAGSVIDISRHANRVPIGSDHPAIFPVELPAFVMLSYTNTGEAVYDPFVGSGTTIIAAEREKRRCYAMEIAPEYVDIAVVRWEAFTGRTAKRA